jgi:WD40-like Beta Propeller Repeat
MIPSCLALALTARVGCRADRAIGPQEQLGTAIAEGAVFSPRWSPDGSEILYQRAISSQAWESQIESYDLRSGSNRVIRSGAQNGPVLFANNGASLCYFKNLPQELNHDPGYALVCVARLSGAEQTIAASEWDAPGMPIYWVASADTLIAYAAHGGYVDSLGRSTPTDTIYLYSTRSGRAAPLGVGFPETFSPDGRQLLYMERPCDFRLYLTTCRQFIKDLVTGAVTEVWAGPSEWDLVYCSVGGNGAPNAEPCMAARWDSSGLHSIAVVLFTDWGTGRDSLVVRDLQARTTQVVYTWQQKAAYEYGPQDPTLAPDGKALAYWVLNDPEDGGARLRITNLRTGRTQVVAVTDFQHPPGTIAVAPDGKHVAYMYGSRIYLSDIE